MSICYQCDFCGNTTGKEINTIRINKRILRGREGFEYNGWGINHELQVCNDCAFKMFDAATDGKFSSGELRFAND